MDLSALIFVALAVAWAVYLIPKALRHHEEDAATRSVDRFSDQMRVLARRQAVSPVKAELVVKKRDAEAPTAEPAAEPAAEVEVARPAAPAVRRTPTPLQARLRRAAAARAAARRRRRVLGLILLANLVVIALATRGTVAWGWVAIPATLLVAWLVACRLMVKKERASRVVKKRRTTLADVVIDAEDAEDVVDEEPEVAEEVAELTEADTSEFAAVATEVAEPAASAGWDPVPMTLPTYVAKAPAGRTVRTIDLDSTGVWSSGRKAADSELANEARATAPAAEEKRRASGA